MTSESSIQREIIAALRTMLGPRAVIRIQAAGGRKRIQGAGAGVPDLLVLLKGGRCLWIEVKTEAADLNPAQAGWHGWACGMEHPTTVARTVADAVAFVRRHR